MPLPNRNRLYVASCFTLITIALTFAIRGDILGQLSQRFQLSNEQLGWIAGAAFWGFTISIFIGGQLCDVVGLGRLLALAFLGHMGGVLTTIFAQGFWTLWIGTLLVGLGNGLVEAAINPLIATVYPEQKTEKLNALHAWFPGGIVIAGLAAVGMTALHLNWQVKMTFVLLPCIIYGALLLGQKFPATERVQHGVSTAEMYRQVLQPRFLIWVFCMLLTASTELGPNQWIPTILTQTAHLQGILVLAWINGIMACGRLLAGPVVRLLTPVMLLLVAACLSALGLLLLSAANSPASAFLSATLFAVGICYFWPTMLGVASERFPSGGALLLAIVGGAGNLSVAIVLPLMGRIYDQHGPAIALKSVVALPTLLIVIFALIWLNDRGRGGYKVVKLSGNEG